uniref:Exosome component 10 n=1 Tax=Myotis myotis TaxID=51298 RepID=A0A7J7ZV98_MYOMY|nr:exosome component 10 [Myotis myotis]
MLTFLRQQSLTHHQKSMKSATVGSWQARYRYKKNLKKLPRRRQLSKQLPGTRPPRSTRRRRSRPCLSGCRRPYVLAFLLGLCAPGHCQDFPQISGGLASAAN